MVLVDLAILFLYVMDFFNLFTGVGGNFSISGRIRPKFEEIWTGKVILNSKLTGCRLFL